MYVESGCARKKSQKHKILFSRAPYPHISEHEREDTIFERFGRPHLKFPPKLNFQLQKPKKLEPLEVHVLHHYSDDRSGKLSGKHLSVSITVESRMRVTIVLAGIVIQYH